MNENDDSPSSKGLLYQARLPLFWKCGADEVSDQQLVAAEDLNERMLQTLITLQEGHIESTEEAQERMPELIRIEAKLDMLLEWVSQLSPRADQGLESFPVRLGATGVSWEGALSHLPEKSEYLWLYLQLDERLPRPLQLFGRVVAVDVIDTGHSITLVFQDLGQRVTDLLEKVIFRQHRRGVALKRSHSVPEV
ncbi:MAG: PilZ domain-containing protein [Sedimenticola sp.]